MNKGIYLISLVAVLLMTFIAGAMSYIFFGDDKPIEQLSEHIIKQQTGLQIDFSPE